MPMKFLAVDDEDMVRVVLVKTIEKAEPGCVIEQAGRPKDALEIIRKGFTPDIAFLDIEMYGMSGLELAKQIQQMCSMTEIVFVTGYSQYTIDAFALHAHGYLLKPVSLKQVQDEIFSIKEKMHAVITPKELVDKIRAEKESDIGKKIAACKTSDEAYAVAKSAGMNGTKDEFVTNMVEYYKSMKELSDADLDKVAGGVQKFTFLKKIINENKKNGK